MIRNTCREALQYIGTHTHTHPQKFFNLIYFFICFIFETGDGMRRTLSDLWGFQKLDQPDPFMINVTFFFIVFQWVFLYFSLWPKHDFRTRILGLQNTPSLWSTLTRSIRHDCHSVVVEQKDSKPVLMMLSLSFAKCDFEIEFLLFWWDFC